MQTIDENTIADNTSRSAPVGSAPPHRQPNAIAAPIGQHGHGERRLDRPQEAERPADHVTREQVLITATGRTGHGVGLGALRAERERGQQVGADVERQDLEDRQHQRDPSRRERPYRERRELGDVVGQVIRQELPDVVERGASLLHRDDDVREAVVQQDEVRRLSRDVRAGRPHRHADVGLPERRRVVHPVTRHRHDRAPCLEGARDPELLLGQDPRQDADRRILEQPAQVVVIVRQVAPQHDVTGGQADGVRDRAGGGGMVSRDHHDAEPCSPAGFERRRDLGPHGILQPDEAEEDQVLFDDDGRGRRPVVGST